MKKTRNMFLIAFVVLFMGIMINLFIPQNTQETKIDPLPIPTSDWRTGYTSHVLDQYVVYPMGLIDRSLYGTVKRLVWDIYEFLCMYTNGPCG